MASHYEELIYKAYSAFNERNIGLALSAMHPDVEWPKAFEGGYVQGHEAIREYWTKQWAEIDPNVDPVGLEEKEDGRVAVKVHQVVKDLDGDFIFDGVIKHIYVLEDGLLRRMDIEPDEANS